MPLHIQYIYVGITNCFTLFYKELKWMVFVGSFFPLYAISASYLGRMPLQSGLWLFGSIDVLSFRPKRSEVEKSLEDGSK